MIAVALTAFLSMGVFATSPSAADSGPGEPTFTTADDANPPQPIFTSTITHVDEVPTTANPTPVTHGSLLVIEYALSNEVGADRLYDVQVTECLPSAFTLYSYFYYPALTIGSSDLNDPDCDGALIGFRVLDSLVLPGPSSPVIARYYAWATHGSPGEQYVSTATLTGYDQPASEGSRTKYSVSSTTSIQMDGSHQTHTVSPSTAAVGEQVTYRTTTTLPGDVHYAQAQMRQTVPAGIKVIDARVVSDAGIAFKPAEPVPTDGLSQTSLIWEADTSDSVIPAADTERIVVTEVDGVIVDAPGTTAGDRFDGTAHFSWRAYDIVLPAWYFGRSVAVSTAGEQASVTVSEPALTVANTINGVTGYSLEVSESYDYEVAITNANTPTTATAYDTTVIDNVPAGVVVDRSTISAGGVASPAQGDVETVTWTLDSLAPGASVVLAYQASLAENAGIREDDSFTHAVDIPEYFSSPGNDPNADERRAYPGPTATATVDPLFWLTVDSAINVLDDTPYIEYRLAASPGIDLATEPVTLAWFKDADGNGVPEDPASRASDVTIDDPSAAPVATYTIDGAAAVLTMHDGTEVPVAVEPGVKGAELTGRMYWPGTVIDEFGVGVGWPGWRVAVNGETPTFENLIFDESLLGANLLTGALLEISVNPGVSLNVVYPETPADSAMQRLPTLEIRTQATVTAAESGDEYSYLIDIENVDYGAAFPVVLTDAVPSTLRVVSIETDVPTDPSVPTWDVCTVTGQDADGYGGDVRCELQGYLGYGQSAPRVTINVAVHPVGAVDNIVNHASVTWVDPDGESPDGTVSSTTTVSVAGPIDPDSAGETADDSVAPGPVSNDHLLATTGVGGIGFPISIGVVLLGAGVVIVVVTRRRRLHTPCGVAGEL